MLQIGKIFSGGGDSVESFAVGTRAESWELGAGSWDAAQSGKLAAMLEHWPQALAMLAQPNMAGMCDIMSDTVCDRLCVICCHDQIKVTKYRKRLFTDREAQHK